MKFFEILKEAGLLKKNLKAVENQLKEIEVKGEAGAGLVRVYMDGMQNVKRVELDEEALKDKKMLEDLLTVAYNSARKKAQEEAEMQFKKMIFNLRDILKPEERV